MAGNKRMGMVIQERDRQLLRELAVMRVVDREQAKVAGGFHSTTRVNGRLLALVRAGLLKRFFLGTNAGGTKALYALSAKGAQVVDAPVRGPQRRKDAVLAGDYFIEHQLTVNGIYLTLKHRPIPVPGVVFHRWLSFFQPVAPGLRLIPDGYAEFETPSSIVGAFLEVDLGHERGPVWKEKVENYLRLALAGPSDGEAFHRPFRVLVIAPTDRRLFSIRKVVAVKTEKIFWFASLEAMHRDGLFAPIWLRPKGENREPLIKETEEHP
jgi:Replication-relaxation